MKRVIFLKYLILFILVSFMLFLAYFSLQNEINTVVLNEALEADIRQEATKMMENLDSSSGLGFAIKGLTVTQGDEGQEKWKIRAEWATIKQEIDIIEANMVVGSYFVNKQDSVYVQANSATITDQQKYLVLEGDVYTEFQGDIIEGDRLDYDSSIHTLTFSEGAEINSKTMLGSSNLLTWDLNENVVSAKGNVQVSFPTRNNDNL